MRKTFLYLIGGQLATISIPAFAQDAAANPPVEPLPDEAVVGDLTPDQMAESDTWPAERQAMFKAWPLDAQAYFWSLPPERQALFWRLNDKDRLALTAMSDANRDAAWTMIEKHAAEQRATAPGNPASDGPAPKAPGDTGKDMSDPDGTAPEPPEEQGDPMLP